MTDPVLRPATAADLPTLIETVRQGFETYRTWAPRGWDPPPTDLHRAGIRGRLRERGCFCAIAEDERGEPAGQVGTVLARRVVGASPVAPAGHVWMLFVREAWWGQGLAARLLDAAAHDGRERGYAELRLQTPAEHRRARAFYAREGWVCDDEPRYEAMLGLVLVGYRLAL
jgi:GNAT superfamily N-acetyltransferase